MIYQVKIPIPEDIMQRVEFGFTHPAILNTQFPGARVETNNPLINAGSYIISAPDACPILSPVNGVITAFDYTVNIPRHSMSRAHGCNFLEITSNNSQKFRLTHLLPKVEIGSKVEIGETVGELYGWLGDDADMDAHLHLNLRSTSNHKMQLYGLPPNWTDFKRTQIQRQIDIITAPNQLSEADIISGLTLSQRSKQDIKAAVRAQLPAERQRRSDIEQICFDAEF